MRKAQPEKGAEPAARHEDDDPTEGAAQPEELEPGKPLPQEQVRDGGHDDGRGRGEQRHVGGVGRMPGLIDEGVETGDAEQGHENDFAPCAADEGKRTQQAPARKGEDGQKRDAPAPKGQLNRREGSSEAAGHDEIPAPDHGGEQGEQVSCDGMGKDGHGWLKRLGAVRMAVVSAGNGTAENPTSGSELRQPGFYPEPPCARPCRDGRSTLFACNGGTG